MTAIVAVELRAFNEIYLIADTRVSYGTDHDPDYGVQKIIPVIGANKRSIGAIGFSGYLSPIKVIVRHLLLRKKITRYKSPFEVERVVENLRCFIQEGFNQVPDQDRDQFIMMFTAIDTIRTYANKQEKDWDDKLKG